MVTILGTRGRHWVPESQHSHINHRITWLCWTPPSTRPSNFVPLPQCHDDRLNPPEIQYNLQEEPLGKTSHRCRCDISSLLTSQMAKTRRYFALITELSAACNIASQPNKRPWWDESFVWSGRKCGDPVLISKRRLAGISAEICDLKAILQLYRLLVLCLFNTKIRATTKIYLSLLQPSHIYLEWCMWVSIFLSTSRSQKCKHVLLEGKGCGVSFIGMFWR